MPDLARMAVEKRTFRAVASCYAQGIEQIDLSGNSGDVIAVELTLTPFDSIFKLPIECMAYVV